MRRASILAIFFILVAFGAAQTSTTSSSAFPSTSVTFNLTPVTLPGAKTSLAGAETDAKLKVSTNLAIGETNLIGGDYAFIGERSDYVIPQFSKWLQNTSPTLNGYQFQLGVTQSLGVIRSPVSAGTNASHWGERAGMFLNYAMNGNTGLGFEAQWCNFPGYAHSTYSIAFGPNFHF